MIEPRERDRRAVFVTGAAGFIGSELCRQLASAGYEVVGYDNLSRGRRENLPPGASLVEGDIRDRTLLHETISRVAPHVVIHLAAMHFIPECIAHPVETLAVNVDGTGAVLECCRNGSVEHVVFASSAAVYAPVNTPCSEEETPLRPLEIYGESKVAGERLMTAFHQDTSIPTTILRLFNAVGRRETNPHVVPHIFESLRHSDAIPLGNLAPRRDYIDTRDVAEAFLAVLAHGRGCEVLNVGTGVACSVTDIVESLQRILERNIQIVSEPLRARASERMVLIADVEKIERVTGWRARIPLDDTLRDLVELYGLRTGADARV